MYIRGIGAYLPTQRVTTQYAVNHCNYPVDYLEKDGYTSAAIEPKLFAPQMAIIATRAALQDAKTDGSGIQNLIYASIHWQGYERIWNPASYIQHQFSLHNTLPLNIQHGCNGGFLALQQVFRKTEYKHQLLLVSADNFTHSSFSRWNADYGLIYGDAAVSTLFDSERGFAKVLFFETKTIPELEHLHRLDQPHCENEVSWLKDYDIKTTKKHFLQNNSRDAFTHPILFCLESIKEQMLKKIKPSYKPISWLITPFVGNSVRLSTYEKVFLPLCARSFWNEGKQIGHTGASDALLGVNQLLHTNQVNIGDQILLVSAGAGFTCSVMLIEITPEFKKKGN